VVVNKTIVFILYLIRLHVPGAGGIIVLHVFIIGVSRSVCRRRTFTRRFLNTPAIS